jgi:hypothetical protein
MTRLKLAPLEDDKPMKVTVELPAALHRDLAAILAAGSGQPPAEPARLIVPMLEHFLASDRGFRAERAKTSGGPRG